MAARPVLSVLIPAYNEAATIREVLDEYVRAASEIAGTFEIVVMDDASRDATPALAAAAAAADPRIRVLRHERNAGIEPTLIDLYRASLGEWLFYAPADGQVPAEALRVMWPLRDGCAAVVGKRTVRAASAWRRLVSGVYALVIRTLFGIAVRDINSTKLQRGDLIRPMPIRSRTLFAEAEILVRLRRGGGRVTEVGIPLRPRRAGVASGAAPGQIAGTFGEMIRFFFDRS